MLFDVGPPLKLFSSSVILCVVRSCPRCSPFNNELMLVTVLSRPLISTEALAYHVRVVPQPCIKRYLGLHRLAFSNTKSTIAIFHAPAVACMGFVPSFLHTTCFGPLFIKRILNTRLKPSIGFQHAGHFTCGSFNRKFMVLQCFIIRPPVIPKKTQFCYIAFQYHRVVCQS